MKLPGTAPVDLTYCTNVHPGETWDETFASLERYVLPIKRRVSPGQPFGVGLRLSADAAATLAVPDHLAGFKDFLADHDLYVFTLNGFPYGRFHGARVKEAGLSARLAGRGAAGLFRPIGRHPGGAAARWP
jgi:hypothetical protein